MNDAVSDERWYSISEVEEFIRSLEFSAELATKIEGNPRSLPWLLISLHHALQGACVCALRGADTSGISVLTEKSGARLWQWLDVDSRKIDHKPPPEERLASLLDLYGRVRDHNYLECPLVPDCERDADVERLHKLRNHFMHFSYNSFSVELSGLAQIVFSVVGVVRHLALEHSSFWHHLDSARRARIKAALDSISRAKL